MLFVFQEKHYCNNYFALITSEEVAVSRLLQERSIHRDLHSGNILYSEYSGEWYVSDFGFCGPADKPLGSIYGNLPYIAPEVINGKGYTFASDIYSIEDDLDEFEDLIIT
ncbi:13412_t:CDS:2 [Funneliformis geosporum]|uniref:13412_t:CDS:1 n=1 Tax=Funneliformis geosporum TaxID=1117311 RepID=A0A9W4SMR3_9GLOM|nr:13412_t:CDS:2 [Funneliformis geosporum]